MLWGGKASQHNWHAVGVKLVHNNTQMHSVYTITLNVLLPAPYLDLTPPQVRLSSSPLTVSRQTSWTFHFRCVNEWRCTYMCSVYSRGSSAQYAPCSRTWTASPLQNGGNYVFAVFATDGVGNIGSPRIFRWTVGKTNLNNTCEWFNTLVTWFQNNLAGY